MFVISLRGVEEKSPIFLAFKVSLRVARKEMQQFFLNLFYLPDLSEITIF